MNRTKTNYMRRINRVLSLFIILVSPLLAQGQGTSPKNESLNFEILLTDNMVTEMGIKGSLINSFSITSERLILLSTENQYFLLGWGGLVPMGKKINGKIGSFALTPQGSLLTIRGTQLCYFDDQEALAILYDLPSEGMNISSGKEVMYLYSGEKDQNKYPLYILAQGGKYLKLTESDYPISSVVEMNESVLFATGNRLYSIKPDTRVVQVLAETKNKETIESIAVDTVAATVYFATRNTVYAIKNNKVGAITNELGGRIGYLNGLIIYNPENKLMMRIVGLDKTMTGNPQPVVETTEPIKAVEVLTNTSITDLVKSELTDPMIIAIIRRSKVNFNLGVDAIIELSGQGVSSDVIMEMKQAMKRQSVQVQEK